MQSYRVGLFGGTFDPIHLGHLIAAEQVREGVSLDKVIFIPAANPPHKLKRIVSSFENRLRMLELAIEGNSHFEVDEIESRLGDMSFTVNTLRFYRQKHPDWDLFFLIGMDNLLELETWREPEEILKLCRLVVFTRPGFGGLDKVKPDISAEIIYKEITAVDIAASVIRQRVRNGRSIKYLVPGRVEDYIRENGLYSGHEHRD